MPKKIKKRKRSIHQEESMGLSSLIPDTIPIECPYETDIKAALEDVYPGLDDELEYSCVCEREDKLRICTKSIKTSQLLASMGVKIINCPPE